MNIVAQIISLVGFIFFILSIQLQEKRKLIIMQFIANLLYGIGYFILNVKIAFFMNIISCIRCILIYYSKNYKPKYIYLFILICLIVFLGFTNYTNVLSLIPICITLLYTISTWQNDMKIIRYCFIIAAFIWIFYNYKVGAYVVLFGNIFEIISGIVSLKRYKKIDG